MSQIGQRLRELRGGKTLAEFADQMDVSRSAWSNYEAGRRLPSHETIKRIAQRLGISPDSLLPGTELKRTIVPTESHNWTASIPALWLYNRLGPLMVGLSEQNRLLWWAANFPSLTEDLENKIHDYSTVRNINTIDAAYAVCEDLEKRTDRELLAYVSAVADWPD
ncbi:XRE family transcriptional regulator [Rhizobium rosettiformans]|uniref:XRE family transcriptional regulator n=1 Tax=Rhizobium rosettiformans TaxID=1368430 RepID=A0ABX7F033_9HYPH|nr:helix-turn-helix transcriptional regulator [Rhizobium rosettiformans]QRF53833.1 XRE family transcriptional regulator [Rhizobium rosettiformans]